MADFQRLGLGLPLHVDAGISSGFTSSTLDAAGKRVAWVFQAPEAATITELMVSVSAVAGTAPTYRVSLQGVNLATGQPDGTVKGGASPAQATFTPAVGTTFLPTDNGYVCTRGQFLAVVVEPSGGVPDAGNYAAFNVFHQGFLAGSNAGLPYATQRDGSAWVKNFYSPLFGYRSAAGATYGWPVATAVVASNNFSNTLELALRFRFDAGCGTSFRVAGARTLVGLLATGRVGWMTLYDGTTVLHQVGLPTDVLALTGNGRQVELYFNAPVLQDLPFGRDYYLGFCVSGGDDGNLYTFDVPAARDLSAYGGGTDFHLAHRAVGGITTAQGPASGGAAWTADPTKRPYIELLIDDWTGGGSGGGVRGISRSRSILGA